MLVDPPSIVTTTTVVRHDQVSLGGISPLMRTIAIEDKAETKDKENPSIRMD